MNEQPTLMQEINSALRVIEEQGQRLANMAYDNDGWELYSFKPYGTRGSTVDRAQNAIDDCTQQLREAFDRLQAERDALTAQI